MEPESVGHKTLDTGPASLLDENQELTCYREGVALPSLPRVLEASTKSKDYKTLKDLDP